MSDEFASKRTDDVSKSEINIAFHDAYMSGTLNFEVSKGRASIL